MLVQVARVALLHCCTVALLHCCSLEGLEDWQNKLDGVGCVDNGPSADYLNCFVKNKIKIQPLDALLEVLEFTTFSIYLVFHF